MSTIFYNFNYPRSSHSIRLEYINLQEVYETNNDGPNLYPSRLQIMPLGMVFILNLVIRIGLEHL